MLLQPLLNPSPPVHEERVAGQGVALDLDAKPAPDAISPVYRLEPFGQGSEPPWSPLPLPCEKVVGALEFFHVLSSVIGPWSP